MATTSFLGLGADRLVIVPLLSSSLTLFYAVVEPTIFIPFLRSAQEDASTHKVIPRWWKHFLPAGLITIFSVTLPSIVTGSFAMRVFPARSLKYCLCGAGAAATLAHFFFAPAISKTIENLIEDRGDASDNIRRWLRIHLWRTLVADIPSTVCFAWVVFGPDAL